MKYSIIIPAYNAETTIVRCVESILNQTFSDFELIIINDGSTDQTCELLNQLKKEDSRIKIDHQKNKGASSARNRGINISTGDYIIFIDSDDWIDPNYLASFSSTPDLFDNLKIGAIAVTNLKDNIEYDLFSNKKNKILNIQSAFSEAGLLHNGFSCSKAYNRKIIIENNLRFKEDISFKEDLIFFLDYLKFCKTIEYIDTTRYHYIVHSNSLSTKKHNPISLLEITKIIIQKSKDFCIDLKSNTYRDSYLRLCTEEIINANYCNDLGKKERILNLKNLIDIISPERHHPQNYKTDKILNQFFNKKTLTVYDLLKRLECKFLRK